VAGTQSPYNPYQTTKKYIFRELQCSLRTFYLEKCVMVSFLNDVSIQMISLKIGIYIICLAMLIVYEYKTGQLLIF
jgi:hypothetical protein